MAGIDWEAIARAETNPLRLRVIDHAAADPNRRFSAIVLAREWGVPLQNVSYHLTALRDEGFLKRAGSARRRGAIERYYRAASKLIA